LIQFLAFPNDETFALMMMVYYGYLKYIYC
jgi:hypothetical protein